MKLRNRHKKDVQLHTSALNDILFILLLFFLIVSTLANPNVIKLAQPRSDSDTKSKQNVVVSINRDKQYFIGQSRVEFDRLPLDLQHYLEVTNAVNPVVVINADKTVPIDNVVGVMRIVRKLGAKSVLAVKK